MRATSIREVYGVETEGADWPKGLSEEQREALIAAVHAALKRNPKGLPSWLLVRDPAVKQALGRGALLDWQDAAVERACRALPNADKRWVLEV